MLNLKEGYRIYFSEVDKTYETHQEKDKLFQIEGGVVRVQLICEITSFENLRNFRIQLNLPYNLYCKEQIKDLRVAKNKDRIIFQLYSSN